MTAKVLAFRNAVEGETFFATAGIYSRVLLGSNDGGCVKVHAKTEGKDGQWFCITCCLGLAHNMERDSHVSERGPRKSAIVNPDPNQPVARHVIAWRNFDSGKVEAP